MKFDKMTTRQLDYMEGFIKKCMAYKVDPEVVFKSAALSPWGLPDMTLPTNMGRSSSLETEPSFLQQFGRGWGNILAPIGKSINRGLTRPMSSDQGLLGNMRSLVTAPGRALGRGITSILPSERYMEGQRNPLGQKGMFNFWGRRGAKNEMENLEYRTNLAKQKRQGVLEKPEQPYIIPGKGSYSYGGSPQQFGSPSSGFNPTQPPKPAPISM